MRRTKIVCTIGPASSSRTKLAGLLSAGMNVARLNFSHGSRAGHAAVFRDLRELAERAGRPLAILQDLCGPKVRFGDILGGPARIRRGEEFVVFCGTSTDDHERIPLPVGELFEALKAGDRLVADDGRIELRVLAKKNSELRVRAQVSGFLSSNKGVAAPGVRVSLPSTTEKDIEDLRFGLGLGADWIAASYVRCAADLEPLRETMRQCGIRRPIVAKIEQREAVDRLDELIEAADGVMVARGDLGVEIPLDEVPLVQKRIIRESNRCGKPVITATQMLDSMIRDPLPTRAEVTDVANAILDGTDAVMLSGETAIGAYPLQAVRMMASVAARAETRLPQRSRFSLDASSKSLPRSVAESAVDLALAVGAKAIICATTSGSTARMIARFRPRIPVVGVTSRAETFRGLGLVWGVRPAAIEPVADTDSMMEAAVDAAVRSKLAKLGDRVVVTAGVPVNVIGNTNLIRVHTVGDPVRPAPSGRDLRLV